MSEKPDSAAVSEREILRGMTAEERAHFLERMCAGDGQVRSQLRALLDAQEAREAIDAAAVETLEIAGTESGAPLPLPVAPRPAPGRLEVAGQWVGPFKLVQPLGEGSFGVVWLAEQERPVRRRVALKILKPGLESQQVIARFEQERQALALMDHPHIAKVLDAGATPTGRPYFVMELVRGAPISEYCEQQRVPTADRLRLFILVCRAVQHAHQKGIIHRDLKPSNILVTDHEGVAVPKVIDFGVAKATQQGLTDFSIHTQGAQMIGTPLYMSPEQAGQTALDVDTRSDVYSLGAVLFELLTGTTPVDRALLRSAGREEVRRLICEYEPAKPSVLISASPAEACAELARQQRTDPARLVASIRGDLDCIVLQALEKDRARRYQTAQDLAADVQRHLDCEPIAARPASALYQLGKAVRRHRVIVGAGAAVAAALVLGLVLSVWQGMRAERERQRTSAALADLRATAPAFAEQARALSAAERFDEALEKLTYAVKLQPDSADYHLARADLLFSQMRLREAADAYRAVLTLKPDASRARESSTLCEELLAAPQESDGRLSHSSLARLYAALQRQQRPAAQLMRVARLLGDEKKVLADYWSERLKDLPIPPDRPLSQRLTVRDDGLLSVDLSQTEIRDLTMLAGLPAGSLNLDGCREIEDFGLLREMRSLVELNVDRTRITNLEPLRGLRLRSLAASYTPVVDLAPLGGQPLDTLLLRSTGVTDLEPLRGMPLRSLNLMETPLEDISPLAGMPLERAYFGAPRMGDLSVLRGMPLKTLSIDGCDNVSNYAALAEIPTLEQLRLPQNYRQLPAAEIAALAGLRTHPKLRQLGAESIRGRLLFPVANREDFWRDWDRDEGFLPRLRASGLKFEMRKQPDGTFAVAIFPQPFRDLSILEGAPISDLTIMECEVTDLRPIRSLPLTSLRIYRTPVVDLAPLQGMRLENLNLGFTQVADLSPLRGMPLRELYVTPCGPLTDLTPLLDMTTLERLGIPITARGVEALRALPRLERLAFSITRALQNRPQFPVCTAEQFWKTWDGVPWARALEAAGFPYKAAQTEDGSFSVEIEDRRFHDCSIFAGSRVRSLSVRHAQITDLRPLAGLPLEELNLNRTLVTDLSPLAQSPLAAALRSLQIVGVKAADLTPLAHCTRLETIDASETTLQDLGIFRGQKLRSLRLGKTAITDLAPLAGMPLEELSLMDTPVTDLRPLLQCRTLQRLILPAGALDVPALRSLPALARISYEIDSDGSAKQSVADFWRAYAKTGWMEPLRRAGLLVKAPRQLPDGTWQVVLNALPIQDISSLRGAPISRLSLMNTNVSDLSPLRGLPLKELLLAATPVTDLTPLRGLPLEILRLSTTKVSDLSPLCGSPLRQLRLNGCTEISDFSPLARIPTLEALQIPRTTRSLQALRSLPQLARLSYEWDNTSERPTLTATDFWVEFDKAPGN